MGILSNRPLLRVGLQAILATALLDDRVKEVSTPAAPVVAEQAAEIIAEKLNRDPVVQQALEEKWYQSRRGWAAVIMTLAPILALLGYQLTPEQIEVLIIIGWGASSLIAAALAWWSRRKPKIALVVQK